MCIRDRLIIEKLVFLKHLERWPKALQHVYALLFIVLGWVIFDFTDLAQMGQFFSQLFTFKNGLIGANAAYMAIAYLPLLAVSIFACLPTGKMLYYRVEKTRLATTVDVAVSYTHLDVYKRQSLSRLRINIKM